MAPNNGTEMDDEIREVYNRLNKEGDTSFWKPKETTKSFKNIIRVLPGCFGNKFYLEIHSHGGIVEGQKTVVCPKMTFDKPCPICEFRDGLQSQLGKNATKEDLELIKSLKPYRYWYLNILDRNEEGKGVQVYTANKTVFSKILEYYFNNQWGNKLNDPKEGFDLEVVRHGQGMASDYDLVPNRMPSVLDESYLAQAKDLSVFAKVKTYEELQEFLSLGSGEAPAESEAGAEAAAEANFPGNGKGAATISKPRCFGQYAEGDRFCAECGVKVECKPPSKEPVAKEPAPAKETPADAGKADSAVAETRAKLMEKYKTMKKGK